MREISSEQRADLYLSQNALGVMMLTHVPYNKLEKFAAKKRIPMFVVVEDSLGRRRKARFNLPWDPDRGYVDNDPEWIER